MKLNLLTLFLVFDHYIGFFASPIAEPQDYDYYVHRGCELAFAPKKELKVFSIPKHSVTSKASVFPKTKIRN